MRIAWNQFTPWASLAGGLVIGLATALKFAREGAVVVVCDMKPEAVDAAVRRVLANGGRIVKAPFRTYYQQWQAVLADPEGHVFRVSCLVLPVEAGAAG